MTTKIQENEGIILKKAVIDAVAKTFNMDPNKISTEEQWGWTYLRLEHKEIAGLHYEICSFRETHKEMNRKELTIQLDNDEIRDAGFGEITKKSGEDLIENLRGRFDFERQQEKEKKNSTRSVFGALLRNRKIWGNKEFIRVVKIGSVDDEYGRVGYSERIIAEGKIPRLRN